MLQRDGLGTLRVHVRGLDQCRQVVRELWAVRHFVRDLPTFRRKVRPAQPGKEHRSMIRKAPVMEMLRLSRRGEVSLVASPRAAPHWHEHPLNRTRPAVVASQRLGASGMSFGAVRVIAAQCRSAWHHLPVAVSSKLKPPAISACIKGIHMSPCEILLRTPARLRHHDPEVVHIPHNNCALRGGPMRQDQPLLHPPKHDDIALHRPSL